MIGATIDQYQITKSLGKTSVAERFLAVHTQTGGRYLLKAILPKLLLLPDFKERLLEDMVRLIKFEHPNVTPIVNVLEDRSRIYIVREYVAGHALSQDLDAITPGRAIKDAMRLFKDALKGVGYAHSEGVVHRALSPEHIIVTPSGEAKLIGFGHTLQQEREKNEKNDTFVTLARYYSPERFDNRNTTDVRANVYTLGAILFHLVTGKPPFEGQTYASLQREHGQEPTPDPTTVNPAVSTALADVVFRAMEKVPEQRFQSTIELYKAVDKLPALEAAEAPKGPDPLKTQIMSTASFAEKEAAPKEPEVLEYGEKPEKQAEESEPTPAAAADIDIGDELGGFSFPSEAAELDSTKPDADEAPRADLGELDFGFDQKPASSIEDSLGIGGDSNALEDAFGEASDAVTSLDDSFEFGMGSRSMTDNRSDEFNFSFGEDASQPRQAEGGDAPEQTGEKPSAASDGGFQLGDAPAEAEFSFDDQGGGKDSGFNLDTGGVGDNMDFSFNMDETGDNAFDGSEMDNSFDFGGHGGNEAAPDAFSFDDEPPPPQEAAKTGGPEDGAEGGFNFNIDQPDAAAPPKQGDEFGDFDFEGSLASINEDSSAHDSDSFNFGLGAPSPQDGQAAGNENEAQGGSAPAEASPFSFDQEKDPLEGGDSPNAAPFSFEKQDDPFSSSSEAKGATADGDDPFAEFAAAEPPGAEAKDADAAPAKFATDDGAFQLERDEPAQSDEPTARRELASSIAQLETEATPPPPEAAESARVKRVKRFDPKILALTAALLVAVVAIAFFWWNGRQKSQFRQGVLDRITQSREAGRYDNALGVIDQNLSGSPSNDFERRLANLREEISGQKEQMERQVEALIERARGLEADGEILTNGKTDAMGAYMSILNLNPDHPEASEASARIKQDQLAQVDSLEEGGQSLEALGILTNLYKAAPGDREIRRRLQDVRAGLKERQSAALIAKIDERYARQNYSAAVAPLKELGQIDPGSDYVSRMKRTLLDELNKQAQDAVGRRRYNEAEAAYRSALQLDPNNKDLDEALRGLKEQRLRASIERSVSELERAVRANNLKDQRRLADKLLGLDPGNQVANSAMARVNTEISKLSREAEEQRELGQFQEAAALYKRIYDIDGDEQIRALWKKFESWTPPPGMVFIPAGEFKMGSNAPRPSAPVHTVSVSNFFIDKYEITNREYKTFVDANPQWAPGRIDARYHDGNYLAHWESGAPKPDDLNRPVTYVSWHAAKAFAQWRGKRLPTEAEWEKAARGATRNLKFWWGNYSDAKQAVYEFYPEKKPAPVGSFPANAYGLFEILGNVNEWVEDAYSESFYSATRDALDPVNRDDRGTRVFRGGSFQSMGRDLAVFLRFHNDSRLCHRTLGFRCVKAAAGDF